MPAKDLRIADLHPAYRSVSHEEAVEMANVGAAVYGTAKEFLREQWATAMGAEEAAKADSWRAEGRMSAIEEWAAKLKDMEGVSVRLAAAEAANEQLQKEIGKRVSEQIDSIRKDYELMSLQKIHVIEKALILAEEKAKHLPHYEDKIAAQATLMEQHLAEIAKLKDAIHQIEMEKVQSSTKSSHTLGKMGEATVFDMLTNVVLPAFPYSTVKDVTAKAHSADFHLNIMTPTGKRVKILVDSKNYTKPVNSDEVVKLYTDVDNDEEAQCGMMISLTTPIHKMRQFEIRTTERHKPVIFLTFKDMELVHQHELLCWSINALMAVVREISIGEKNFIIENIESFLNSIMTSANDIEGVIQSHTRTIIALRQIKMDLIKKITTFRTEANIDQGEDAAADSIQHDDGGGCVTVLKATGMRCGKPLHNDSTKCRYHTSRRQKVTGDDD